MTRLTNGIVAGLVATLVLSMIMIAKGMMGLMPELNVIAMLSSMMNAAPLMGWIAHFMIGSIAWGIGFAFVIDALPGSSSLAKGVSFGVAAWVLMMVFIMPMAGGGVFGLNLGMMAPVMTLMLHAIYGAVLGSAFGRLGSARAKVEA